MTLPPVPEPSLRTLRRRTGVPAIVLDLRRGRRFTDAWVATTAVPAYLWERWRPFLGPRGTDWNAFQERAAGATAVTGEWAVGAALWDQVLSSYEAALEVTIDG